MIELQGARVMTAPKVSREVIIVRCKAGTIEEIEGVLERRESRNSLVAEAIAREIHRRRRQAEFQMLNC
jgi:hypothetical protein